MRKKKQKARAKPARKRSVARTRSRSSPKMVIRRNAPVAVVEAPVRNARRVVPPRPAIQSRVREMGGSHVAAGIGAGTLGNVLGVVAVGKGWIGPKLTAGLLMGTGAIATAAGWYWDADHVLAAGSGLAAAGTFSMVNQLAVDGYEAAEKKAAEKKAEREKEEQAARLAEARKLLEEQEAKRPRNGPRLVVLRHGDPDAPVIDDDVEYVEDAA